MRIKRLEQHPDALDRRTVRVGRRIRVGCLQNPYRQVTEHGINVAQLSCNQGYIMAAIHRTLDKRTKRGQMPER